MAVSTSLLFVLISARICYSKTVEKVPDSVAEIDLSLYDTSMQGEYRVTNTVTLSGHFSTAGIVASADGGLIQLHPISVCSAVYDSDLSFPYGSVIVVKLEPIHNEHCTLTVYQKAEKIIQRGAIAVILDITDDLAARENLWEAGKLQTLERPIVLVRGVNAKELMEVILREQYARATIKLGYNHTQEATPSPRNEFLDMGIFIAFFILIAVICLLLVIRLRWRQRRKQDSQTRQTMHALAKMRTRKYRRGDWRSRDEVVVTPSVASDSSVCAICLDEFRDGEEIRIVPCEHEFHRLCVDPWLVSNKTCPLCMFDILEPDIKASTPSVHSSPVEQYAELRVNLPSTSGEEISQGRNMNSPQPQYEDTRHHRHSLNHAWALPITRHDRRPLTYAGACPAPVDTGQECWSPGYSHWQPQPCDFVCSRCQRRVPKNQRTRVLGPELTSFESHYVSSLANQYQPIPGVNCEGGRDFSPTHPCTPVGPYQTPPATGGDRDSSSDSSLSLSTFHADYECSDSSSSPENENFDSNRSVFGSSTTCKSDPVAPDPDLYARPGAVNQEWAGRSRPVSLTPSCVYRQDDPRLVRLASDNEGIKRSGSDANASGGSNFSTRAHVSCRGSPHPYKPSSSSGTFIQAFVHSAKQKSHSFPRTSGSHLAGAPSRRRHHNTGRTLHSRSKKTRVREIKSGLPLANRHSPCHCCRTAGGHVWETKGHSPRSKVREQAGPSTPEHREGEYSRKRLRDDRAGKQRQPLDRVQSRSKGQHRTRKSRAHLSLPIQSIATVDPSNGRDGWGGHGSGRDSLVQTTPQWRTPVMCLVDHDGGLSPGDGASVVFRKLRSKIITESAASLTVGMVTTLPATSSTRRKCREEIV